MSDQLDGKDSDVNVLDDLLHMEADTDFDQDTDENRLLAIQSSDNVSLADQDLTVVGVSDDLLDQSREEELEDPEEKRGLTHGNDRLEKDSKSAEDTSEALQGLDEDKMLPPGEGLDIQEYETRSEVGSVGSPSSSPTKSYATGGEAKEDGSMDVSQETDGGEKSRRRAISPITWDKRDEPVVKVEEDEEKTKFDALKKDHNMKLKYVFRNARYFLVKSNNYENIALAKAKGVWSTPPQNEAKLNMAYKACRQVILIFSVKESGRFQGYARLCGEVDKDHPPVRWVLPPGMSDRAFNGVFKIDWVNRNELAFAKAGHLRNSWNEDKPVKIGRDGQEIDPNTGETLCRLFALDDSVDLRAIALKAKRAVRDLEASKSNASASMPSSNDKKSSEDRLALTGLRDWLSGAWHPCRRGVT